ncbi:MAG: hypothetical protein RIG82_03005 [Phycisphaeraceae bacterium]
MAEMPWGFRYQNLSTPTNPWGRAARANWAFSVSILLAALVVVLPLIALFLTAVLVGMVAYIVLSLLAALLAGINSLLQAIGIIPNQPLPPDDHGRENVRIIR